MNSNSNPRRKGTQKAQRRINRETRQTHERGGIAQFSSLSAFGGEGRCEVAPRLAFSLSPLLLFVWFVCFAVHAPAATFTTNALITETDTAFDGQDIVVSGATLTVDGRHSCPCS